MTRIRAIKGSIVVLAPFVSACGRAGGDAAAVSRTDSAGITIVTSHAAERQLDWSLDTIFTVGGEDDGPEAFARVYESGIGVDGAKNLYVLDSGNYRVSVFDADGTFIRSMGRQGGGPGELRFPSDMAVAPDGTVAVYDFDRVGAVRYGSDGAPLSEVHVNGALQRKIAITPAGLVGVTLVFGEEADTLRLIEIGDDTTRLTAVSRGRPKAVQLGSCMTVAMPPVFSPSIVWAARGDTIGVNEDASYTIRVRAGGKLRSIFRRDLEPLRATADLAARELGSDSLRFVAGSIRCAVSAADAAAATGFADVVPPIRNLILSPDGTWWVQRRVGGPERTRIDVLSADGEYVGTLPAGTPWPAAFRAADEFVAVERDELDVASVVAYRIRKGDG